MKEHQCAKPLVFSQNHPERVLFSSKQYKNTVYQNLNTMQPVGGGGGGHIKTQQAPTLSAAPSQDNNTTIGPLEPAKRVIT